MCWVVCSAAEMRPAGTAATPSIPTKSDDSSGGLGGMLGDILSSPVGKAVLAGTAAYAMKEVLGGKK